jgi:hypothetical protein
MERSKKGKQGVDAVLPEELRDYFLGKEWNVPTPVPRAIYGYVINFGREPLQFL